MFAVSDVAVLGVHNMRLNKPLGSGSFKAVLPNATAKIFDFVLSQAETSRLRRIAVLERENALLSRAASEILLEIAHLRALLAAQ
jgi:hypothetical protein